MMWAREVTIMVFTDRAKEFLPNEQHVEVIGGSFSTVHCQYEAFLKNWEMMQLLLFMLKIAMLMLIVAASH